MVRWVHKLQDSINNSIKYNRIYKIAPAVFYMYLRSHGIPVSSNELIDKLELDRYIFLRKIKYFYGFLPKYSNRDKKKLINQHIKLIIEKFKFSEEFEDIAHKILIFVYHKLMTTERVISAVVCCLSMLYLEGKKVGYNKICNALRVAPSSVIYQVKIKLLGYQYFKGGLISLKRPILEYLNNNI
jgi:transcription initiation factor TFIIIB Brf1 subunit/transcription initiation factor TFIIB